MNTHKYVLPRREMNDLLGREIKNGVMRLEKFFEHLDEYLKRNKIFITSPKRYHQFMLAFETAKKMFPDAKVYVTDDPLQTGSLFLDVEDLSLTVRETEEFAELIEHADNFEVFPIGETEIKLSICFDKVFKGEIQK